LWLKILRITRYSFMIEVKVVGIRAGGSVPSAVRCGAVRYGSVRFAALTAPYGFFMEVWREIMPPSPSRAPCSRWSEQVHLAMKF